VMDSEGALAAPGAGKAAAYAARIG